MDIRLNLDLKLTQKLIMTPQLQQAIKLLQLSHLELSQTINQELVENPLLEELSDIPHEPSQDEKSEEARSNTLTKEHENGNSNDLLDSSEFYYKWNDYINEVGDGRDWGYQNSGRSNDEYSSLEHFIPKSTSLISHLLWQLNMTSIPEEQREIGAIIIGNIDDDGYLKTTLEELEQLTGASATLIETTLKTVQDFDPPGVCARNLKECILNQVLSINPDLSVLSVGQDISVLSAIITDHLDDLVRKNYHKISRTLNITLEDVFLASKIIEGLEPKPGRPFSDIENTYIIPDVYIIKHENNYIVYLNDDGMPKLKINSYYKKLLQNNGNVRSTAENKTKDYIQGKFKSAIWLIKSIEQRNKTICRVTESIINFQREFLDNGITYLKPLILKQVADDIEMHESTISRVTANKFVHTPQGIYELKFFFTSNIPRIDDLEDGFSSLTVREMIRKLISGEDGIKPLKDQEIRSYLYKKNVDIARRTIAKYRAELNIPPASRRKRFY